VLRAELATYADRPLRIGAFSAASNVTGILTATRAIARTLHEHDALSFWDFAAVGNPVPVVVGGGTVSYVNPTEHRYLADPAHREEGGTPAIIESIRAGLVLQLKQAVGSEVIQAREADFVRRAIRSWAAHRQIQILGNLDTDRLAIVSFEVRRPGGRRLHHNFVVAVLNDLFGIQARGGCSCAGPYGHRLLDIDLDTSHEFEREILHGCEGIKPGWTRVNFNYFIGEDVFRYVVEAVHLIASFGYRLLPEYAFDPLSGLWRHRESPPEPAVRLTDIAYDGGSMQAPAPGQTVAPVSLSDCLDEARKILQALPDPEPDDADDGARVSAEFERLRWFELPAVCLPTP
jgi:selenocysteine lyase/cysteine desulfurase